MQDMNFQGRARLVKVFDDAVACGTVAAITDNLRTRLCELIRDRDIVLPACVFETREGHYARRQLHHSAQFGYTVMAMTWGPGQGTPVHDHAGMWCVEGVWHGELEIVQYELLEKDGANFRMRPAGTIRAGAGSAGSLIPPHEYHTIRNPSATETCVSVHVYSGPMTECCVFQPRQADWFQRESRALSLDPAA